VSVRVCVFVCVLFSFRSVLRARCRGIIFYIYIYKANVCLFACECDGRGPYRNHHPPPPTWYCSFQDYLHFWKNWNVACSLGSILRTRCWAKVVFSFRSVQRLSPKHNSDRIARVLKRRSLCNPIVRPLPSNMQRCSGFCECDDCGPYRNHHRPTQRGFVLSNTTYIIGKIG
jgi:hypothetical protein